MRRLSPSELYKAVMDGRTIGNHEMTLAKEGDHWVLSGGGFISGDIRRIQFVEKNNALLLSKVLEWPSSLSDSQDRSIDIPLGIFDISGGFLIEEADE